MINIKKHDCCKPKCVKLLLLAALIAATLIFFAGCVSDQVPGSAGGNDNNGTVSGKEGEIMTDEMRARPGIPPVDEKVPEELKTATLAMG